MTDHTLQVAVMLGLQALTELELTQRVLIPLFEAMGYSKADYHGGPYEGGIDLILWKKGDFDITELSVAQVKKWKPSARASDPHNCMEVITQLQQAATATVPHADKQRYRPATVYFITPYQIDTRALEVAFGEYATLHATRLRIIDGPILAESACNRIPEVARDLLGTDAAITAYTARSLTNETLLRALESDVSSKNIGMFYSDLELVVGTVILNVLLTASLNPHEHFTLKESAWPPLRRLLELLHAECGLHPLAITHDAVDEAFKRERKRQEQTMVDQGKRKHDAKTQGFEADPAIAIPLDRKALKAFLEAQRALLPKLVAEINDRSSSLDNIRTALLECHKRIHNIDRLVNSVIGASLGITQVTSNKYVDDVPFARIETPFSRILDAGLNVAIFGDAGAGKTTTLQMEARRRLRQTNQQMALYFPLAAMFGNDASETSDTDSTELVDRLENAMATHLRGENIRIRKSDIEHLLAHKTSLLLFDGVDEGFAKAPWIIDAIDGLAKRYPNAQLALSARSGGRYLSKVPFVSVGLLPLTPQQRTRFIQGWFNDPEDHRIAGIIAHLESNSELAEIVTNPLLVTTLCTLAEHNVPLPDSEVRIYQSRLRLLLGEYDAYKGIRRITSTRSNLHAVSRKLAFALHLKQVRQFELPEIMALVISMARRLRMSEQQIITAINEMIYPCNVLVPMNSPIHYGFGHLRYQEHLAAEEVNQNREIDVSPLMRQEWWRGALVLFSKLAGNVDRFIEDAINGVSVLDARSTIEAMLSAVGSEREATLRRLLDEKCAFEARSESYTSER